MEDQIKDAQKAMVAYVINFGLKQTIDYLKNLANPAQPKLGSCRTLLIAVIKRKINWNVSRKIRFTFKRSF
jgi:hypothetical protein